MLSGCRAGAGAPLRLAPVIPPLPGPWQALLGDEVAHPCFSDLAAFVAAERAAGPVHPPAPEVFEALRLTPPEAVRVVLLGQDPYHGAGQAHGLAFSVRPGTPHPPSLRNVLRELHDDLGCPVPASGSLAAWAERGVLLLNTVLTVRQGEPLSHRGRGWERFTDAVLGAVTARREPVVFLLWGGAAARRATLIPPPHHVVRCAHPSPLSAHRGFLGSRPFSRASALLEASGRGPIDWCLPAG
jgi:uracil-DNA glycosylase